MHLGEYSADEQIHWCCGKIGKDAPGCKFSAHESKEDEDDDDENTQDKGESQKFNKYLRCTCCKEIGHSVDDCPRDPNIKTKGQAEAEF